MRYLLIEQHSDQRGLVKSWRLRPQQGIHTFGSSKNAKLRSPLLQIKGFQGFFEYKDGEWWYTSLDPKHSFTIAQTQSYNVHIKSDFDFIVHDTLVKIKSIQVREDIHNKMDGIKYKPDANKNKKYHLVLLKEGHLLHTTKMIPFGKNFTYVLGNQKINLALQDTEDWKHETQSSMQIQYKTVYSENELPFQKFSFKDMNNKDLMFSYKVLGGVFFTFMAAMLFMSKGKQEEMAITLSPQFTYVPQKTAQKKKEEPKDKAVAATVSAPVYESSAPSNNSKINQKLQISKLSALVGKISSQGARTKNIVITQGIKAGTAPSGKAIANLGKISQNGVDWGKMNGPQGVNVETVGGGGDGRAVASIGALKGGNVGSGNVGLIEDESDISGGLDKEVIAQYIKSQLGQILYCYERQLSANANLAGKVAVKFTIGPKGEVEAQKIGETSLNSATVENCMLQKVSKWKFPTPKGGTRVMVTYPFLFKSTN